MERVSGAGAGGRGEGGGAFSLHNDATMPFALEKYLGAIQWADLRVGERGEGVSKLMFWASFQVKSRHVLECDRGDITKQMGGRIVLLRVELLLKLTP